MASNQVYTVFPRQSPNILRPKLAKGSGPWFAVLTARVGSISANRLEEWTAYRAPGGLKYGY